MRSSYQEANYGAVLQTAVRVAAPRVIVELGVLDGYSTLHLARAAKWLRANKNIGSSVFAFDLFDDYQYKHGDMAQVRSMLQVKKVSDVVTLEKGNAYEVFAKFGDSSIGMLHIDISNDGNTIVDLLKLWKDKIKPIHGWVLFEGGSKERDAIGWMQKYNKRRIQEALVDPFVIEHFGVPMVLNKFPSMTIIQRRANS